MKSNILVRTALVFVAGLGLALTCKAQEYQFTTSFTTGTFGPASGQFTTDGSTGILFYYQSLSETIYLNASAQTVEEVGAVSFTSTSPQDLQFQETQSVAGQFPNPPQDVTGNVMMTVAPTTTSGTITFDTGAQPVTFDSSTGGYLFDANDFTLANSFSTTYSLVTGGLTYSGSFNYSSTTAQMANEIFTGSYPNSLSLDDFAFSEFLSAPQIDVTASNGFTIDLSGDLYGAGYHPGTVVAPEVVPEPSTWEPLLLGAACILFVMKRRKIAAKA